MKNLLFLFAILILFSFKGPDSDCNNIAKIIATPDFEKCFGICRKTDDKIILYIGKYGDLDPDELCVSITASCGKTVTFAKVDFEVKIDETSRGVVVNPRIVVWKEYNKYRFFETETNKAFTASVKKGKVKVTGMGAF
jgi:hypothetical protein